MPNDKPWFSPGIAPQPSVEDLQGLLRGLLPVHLGLTSGSSMEPSFANNQMFSAQKLKNPKGGVDFKVGDVVVMRSPRSIQIASGGKGDQQIVKRVTEISPDGTWFKFMGDNRRHSLDSRSMNGAYRSSQVIAKVPPQPRLDPQFLNEFDPGYAGQRLLGLLRGLLGG